MTTTLGAFLGISLIVIIVVFIYLFRQARKVNLTGNTEEKPAWMRETPPAETLGALMKDGEKVSVYDYDGGEKVAAPFSEQIEDIFRAKIEADPHLNHYKIDLGSAPDGALEIWVDDKPYTNINDLPDEGLKKALRESVAKWNK